MSTTVKAALVSVVVFAAIITAFLVFRPGDDGGRGPEVGGGPPEDPPHVVDTTPPDNGGPQVDEPTVVEKTAIEVSVVDRATGRALTARLAVSKLGEGDRATRRVADERARNGNFRVSLRPGGYLFVVQARGYASEEREVIVGTETERLGFELDRGHTISGRVLDSNGRGVGGAQVFALKEFTDPDADMEEILFSLIDLEKMTDEVADQTVSADDGSYQLEVERFWFTVRAVAPGFAPGSVKKVPSPREKVDVILQPGGRVGGVVVDSSGRPVSGAQVAAHKEPESKAMFDIILAKSRPAIDTAESDGSGQFEFDTLGQGLYSFKVSAPGYQPHTLMKEPVNDSTQLRFELAAGLSLTGYVVGPDDAPVGGARVRYQQIGGAAVGRPETANIDFKETSVEADSEGAFTIDTLGDYEYNLIVYHEDFQTLQRKGVRPDSSELTLRMAYGGRVRGTISDTDGNPVEGARIVASDVADLNKEAVSGSDGAYVISGLQTGRRSLNLTVTAEGYARSRDNITGLANNEREFDFELVRTGILLGLVVNSNNDPIDGATVQVKRADENTSVDYVLANGRSDSSGRFEIPNVDAEGELYVVVKSRGYRPVESELVTVDPGGEAEVPRIVLQLGGGIDGRVVGPDGAAVSGCVVTVRYEDQTENTMTLNPTVTTNSSGEFRLRGLKEGTADLVVKPADLLETDAPRHSHRRR